MAFEITPVGVLVGVVAIGTIAALATACILGMRKNGHFSAPRWVNPNQFINFELGTPYVPDALSITRDGETKTLKWDDNLRFPDHPRVPSTVAVFDDSERIDDMVGRTLERKVGFNPLLAVGYGHVSAERAAQLAANHRERFPAIRRAWDAREADIYACMAESLGLIPFPIESWSDADAIPEGVYWSIDAQNFYGPDDRAMDQAFAEAWWPRMSEFPQR